MHCLLRVSILLFAAVSSAGCDPSCPSQPTGCGHSTTLRIPLPRGTPEVYELSLGFRAGDAEAAERCLVILPPPDDWTTNVPASCLRNEASVYVERAVDVDCSASFPEGAACSVDPQGFVLTIRRGGRVEEVTLQLSRGGQSFAPLRVQPPYRTHYPDGPDCPGSCDVSETVVSFDSLVGSEPR